MSILKIFNMQISIKTCYRKSKTKRLFLQLSLIESRSLIKSLRSKLRVYYFRVYSQVHRFKTYQICYLHNYAVPLTISSRRCRNLKYVTKILFHFFSHLAYGVKKLISSEHNTLLCERFFVYLSLTLCSNRFHQDIQHYEIERRVSYRNYL